MNAEEERKGDCLHQAPVCARGSDLKILTGDFNVKMGGNNSRYEHVMAEHGLGRRNKNRELLADFCAFTNMAIDGSILSSLTRTCTRPPGCPMTISQETRWPMCALGTS